MSKKVFNMQGGKHSAAAYAAFENRLYGSVKATPDSFVVSAGTGMNVNISTGDGLISADTTLARRIQTDAVETATVSTASASYNRIDSVVAYIDSSVSPTTSVTDNTNNILKFAVVAGTAAASPTAPNGAAIVSAIGAGNPYLVLCNVTVPQNAVNLSGATFDNIAPTPLLKNYPIGSIYLSVNSTNPQTLFGGKWQAFATGRTLVGIDAGQTEFDTVEETGGAKTHTLTQAQLPSYNLPLTLYRRNVNSGSNASSILSTEATAYKTNIPSGGSGQAHNNLQPYIVTYMWKRTA